MGDNLCFEAKFYARCEWKPFARTKHKCIRCEQCTYSQFLWCATHVRLRKKIDEIIISASKTIKKSEESK